MYLCLYIKEDNIHYYTYFLIMKLGATILYKKLLKKHMITIASLGILGILYVSNLLYNSAALSVTQKEKDAKFNYILTKLKAANLNICEIFESVKDKFITNLNLFYENLDTLNILEVSALFHLLVIFAFMIIIFNIYSTIFGNEIIKYFKLEEK